ncbi:gamma subclass chorismate mutase AroQ [Kibdelosporangium aridum]|uniref:Gamma subclass chorismate mutase AroQ n=1 Tax=Kibdelosporangium aridum TaxID=2030 RepID=A0A428Z023_KIBAR|nr:gamma subclass chorismate mutase AroQ [Kibdelosporangium aridum]RSM77332.1 gamma subclass chorismate mutase AroQ [Kibdelosporangium aridum]
MVGLAAGPGDPFGPLAELAVRRVMLSDLVAAAKFGTGRQIDDPVREQQILDGVVAESLRRGMPSGPPARFFRAQIKASKIVQRGLFRRWERHPDERPGRTPDLETEVRPQLDLLTEQILGQLHATVELWRPTMLCGIWRLDDIVHPLDELHRHAVAVSLHPVFVR